MSNVSESPVLTEQTFLENSIVRMQSTNNSIGDANNKLKRLLIKLRGEIPIPQQDDNNKEKPSTSICSQVEYLLSENVEPLGILHNQIDELMKYI